MKNQLVLVPLLLLALSGSILASGSSPMRPPRPKKPKYPDQPRPPATQVVSDSQASR